MPAQDLPRFLALYLRPLDLVNEKGRQSYGHGFGRTALYDLTVWNAVQVQLGQAAKSRARDVRRQPNLVLSDGSGQRKVDDAAKVNRFPLDPCRDSVAFDVAMETAYAELP